VDRLICTLDARDLGVSEIIRRVKDQFPNLYSHIITAEMVDRRLRVLDQNVEIDYFKTGSGVTKGNVETGVGDARGVKLGLKIHGSSSREKDLNLKTKGDLKQKTDDELQELLKKAERAISIKLASRPGAWRSIRETRSVHFARQPARESEIDCFREMMDSPLLYGGEER